MATIKSYTDLEQSKKLAEILPLESADMYYTLEDFVDEDTGDIFSIEKVSFGHPSNKEIGCWSLAGLLNILNTIKGWYPGIDAQVGEEKKWQICMFSYETGSDINTASTNEELVDSCYEVILKLNKLKML